MMPSELQQSRYDAICTADFHCVVPENIYTHSTEGHWKFLVGGGGGGGS